MDDGPKEISRDDRELLDRLHDSGPLTLGQLAEMVGRPAPPEGAGAVRNTLSKWAGTSREADANRARRLERNGSILGYRAVLAPNRNELDQIAFVQVALRAMDAETLGAFREAVRAIREIEACHMTAGDFNYLLQVRTKTIPTFRALLTDQIASLPGVARTATIIAMETVKEA